MRVTYRGQHRDIQVNDFALQMLDEHVRAPDRVVLSDVVTGRGVRLHHVVLASGVGEVRDWVKSGVLTSSRARLDPTQEAWTVNSYLLAVLLTAKHLGAHVECIHHPDEESRADAAAVKPKLRTITAEDRAFFQHRPGRDPDLLGPAQRELHYPSLRFIDVSEVGA